MALTDDQLTELKDLLDERQQTLASDVHDELNDTEEREYGHLQGALPGDSGDQSVASTQADLSFRMTDRHTEELQAIARMMSPEVMFFIRNPTSCRRRPQRRASRSCPAPPPGGTDLSASCPLQIHVRCAGHYPS